MQPCASCRALHARAWPVDRPERFEHLRLVYADDDDELLAVRFWWCPACRSWWVESDNRYGPKPEDIGVSWADVTYAGVRERLGDELGEALPPDPEASATALAAHDRFWRAGVGWVDPR